MIAAWKRHAARIDALSLRERLFIFAAVLSAVAALADTLWVSPLWARYKAAREQLGREAAEVAALRTQLQQRSGVLAAAPTDPAHQAARSAAERLRADLDATRREIGALGDEIRTLAASPQEAQHLPEVLQQALRRRDRVTLVRLATLPPDAEAPGILQRRGVEFTLAGRYADLADELAALERAMPRLRWGVLRLAALPAADGAAARAELSVRVDLIEAGS